MIAWLNPLGLVTLTAIAAPILVHLLLRRRAARTRIPTVRFVPRLSPQSVRLRRPADAWLLLVRAGIISCAALALAAPVLVTDARRAASAERIARAVIVDTRGDVEAATAAVVRAERAGSDPSRQEDTRDMPSAMHRAINWLQQSPPARREIVIVSPFRHGTLTDADVAAVPGEIGLRFIRTEQRLSPEPLRGRVASTGGVRLFEVSLDADATTVHFEPAPAVPFAGLVIQARPEDADAVAQLRRVLARVGVADADQTHPIVVRFRGGSPYSTPMPGKLETRTAALRLLQDPAIASLPVTVGASGDELRVDADVDAASFEAATIVRSALDARLDPARFAAHEIASIPDASLESWSRGAATPSGEQWRRSDRSDARWLWLTALLLLAVEGFIRESRPRPAAEVTTDAA